MATTTNFGWETPDDTDLVKDGALAMRTLGNSIDTSFVDLKGGTTGQVLAKASNTDLDFSWVAVDPLTILDAKGDLISATAADTPARLAVGTNGQVLTADSTASTGLKWATPASGGGQTLITTSNFPTSGSATHTISDIPNTYKHLFILLKNIRAGDGSDGVANFDMRFNGDTGNNYGYARAGTYAGGAYGQSAISVHPRLFNSTDTFRQDYAVIDIPRYTDTDTRFFTISAYGIDQNTTPLSNISLNVYKGSSAISSITFIAGANYAGNGIAYVYGIS